MKLFMKLLLCFVMFSLLFVQGCVKEKTSKTSYQTIGTEENSIPYLKRTFDEHSDQYVFSKGAWDIENGKLIFSNKQYFVTNENDGFLKWDGNSNIIIPTSGITNIKTDHINPGLTVKRVPNYKDIEVESTNDNKTIYRIMFSNEDCVLETEKNGVKKTIQLKPPFDKNYTITRAIGFQTKSAGTVFYLELFYIPDDNKSSKHSCAIVRGNYSETNNIDWSVVSRDIQVTESGAGVSMVEYDGNIIIAEQNGRIKQLKLDDGTVKDLEIFNGKIRQFRKNYVYSSESEQPPILYKYKDLLIVKDEPAVTGSQPVVYVLCAKKDKILGEIIENDQKITVYKNDIVTEEKSFNSKYPASTWVFPGT